jgi:methyltransferase (TIGR00027 family)
MSAVYSKTIEKPDGFLFARWSAGAKAFEEGLPPDERIISDPLAKCYAGLDGMKTVAMMQAINPNIRKAIVLRARFIDDYACQCIREGYEQVVLLGAGYDSRFFRLPEFRMARIFELDLGSTQTMKKILTHKFLGQLPPNVTYISMDFSRDTVTDKLLDGGFDPGKKTLFIWEGVTLFLNQAILEETLGRLARMGPGHRVIFDFVPPELVNNETGYRGNGELLQLCAGVQEPLTFGCESGKMRGILQNLGYEGIDILNLREANRIYCGSDQIEDTYLFATAEVSSPADNGGLDRLLIGKPAPSGNEGNGG